MITSTRHPKVKLVRALLDRSKERREEGAFVAEGVRLVEEAFKADWPFRFVLYKKELSNRAQSLINNLISKKIETEIISDALLISMSETETPQGILAVLDHHRLTVPYPFNFGLIPDRIRDPGNLGALLRTAHAAGVQAVFVPPETTDPFAPKVVRAGMGAHFQLPIHSLRWSEIKRITADLQIFLAETGGALDYWLANFHPPLVLIIGGEAEGASEEACKLANQRVCIPMPGKAESLNAAAAGAVLMFEVVRQRTKK